MHIGNLKLLLWTINTHIIALQKTYVKQSSDISNHGFIFSRNDCLSGDKTSRVVTIFATDKNDCEPL